MQNIAIFGAGGTIGQEFVKQLVAKYPNASVHAISRNINEHLQANVQCHCHAVDYLNEEAVKQLIKKITVEQPLDMAIVATGILHDGMVKPEKSLSQLNADNLTHILTVNTIVPSMIAKYCIPKLNRNSDSYFVALSARIGSISDNQLGGWYAYRASKSALNMMLKTASIEVVRKNQHAIILGMHPGTVDSPLSFPFQRNIPAEKLFTPTHSVSKMLEVIFNRSTQDTGKCFGWDGLEILA